MEEKNKSQKKNNKKKPIIDLTSYLSPDIVDADIDGSYTGVPADMYYYGDLEEPMQDADDL